MFLQFKHFGKVLPEDNRIQSEHVTRKSSHDKHYSCACRSLSCLYYVFMSKQNGMLLKLQNSLLHTVLFKISLSVHGLF